MSKFHTLSKADAARQEKNAWRLRANVAENRLRQIRNVLREDSTDGEQVSAIRDVIAAWEHECPNVPLEMAPVKRLPHGEVPESFDGGVRWAVVQRLDPKPLIVEMPSETEARETHGSHLEFASGTAVPDEPGRWPVLVSTRVTWQEVR